MSDSVRPHRRQPTRLPHPWDSLGMNTGVGCHFLLQCMKVKSEIEVAQSCPTLSNPRLLHPCYFPGKSTGVGCHHLLTNTQKRYLFHHSGLECKSRKSRDTCSNWQIWTWSTKGSRVKANRVLPGERTGHSKHRLSRTQEMTLHLDIARWSVPKSD